MASVSLEPVFHLDLPTILCLFGFIDTSSTPPVLKVHRPAFLLQMLANIPVTSDPNALHPFHNKQALDILGPEGTMSNF